MASVVLDNLLRVPARSLQDKAAEMITALTPPNWA